MKNPKFLDLKDFHDYNFNPEKQEKISNCINSVNLTENEIANSKELSDDLI